MLTDRAAALGFDAAAVQRCFHDPTPEPAGPADPTAPAPDELLDRLGGPHGVTGQLATFTRRDVVKWLANNVAPSHSHAQDIEHLADRFLASDRAEPLFPDGPAEQAQLVIGPDGGPTRTAGPALFSTPEILRLEAHVIAAAEHPVAFRPPTAPAAAIEAALRQRPELSPEQVAMVRAVCTSTATVQPYRRPARLRQDLRGGGVRRGLPGQRRARGRLRGERHRGGRAQKSRRSAAASWTEAAESGPCLGPVIRGRSRSSCPQRWRQPKDWSAGWSAAENDVDTAAVAVTWMAYFTAVSPHCSHGPGRSLPFHGRSAPQVGQLAVVLNRHLP